MGRQLKVVHIGKYYPPDLGGIERVTQEMCEGLAERGHEVHVFVSSHETQLKQELIQGVHVHRLPSFGRIASVPLTLWRTRLITDLRPHIIHIHTPNPLAHLMLRFNSSLLTTHHADPDASYVLQALYRKFYAPLLKKSDIITVSSAHNIRHSQTIPQSLLAKVRILPFGISDPLKSVDQKPKRDGQQPFTIGCVGRLVFYKGYEVLLRAIKDLQDYRLIFIGCGPLENNLRKLCAAMEIEGRVEFAGPMQGEELYRKMLSFDIFCQPSLNKAEAFGIAALEAMALGVPLLTTDLPSGVRDVNIDEETGLVVQPGSSEALRKAILSLRSNSSQLNQLSHNCRSRWQQFFSRSSMIDQLENLYRSAIQSDE